MFKMVLRYYKVVIIFLIALLCFGFFSITSANTETLFYGKGCMHCAKVEEYLEKNDIKITQKEIYQNPVNATEFNEICDEAGIALSKRGVPLLYTEEGCISGSDAIINYFKEQNTTVPNESDNPIGERNPTSSEKKLTIPALIGAAIVDAINPCAFAILIILISTLLFAGKRKKALWSGLSFSASIYISYFLMGLGLYTIIASVETSLWFMRIIGVFAILLGLFNIKDFLRYGKGFLMEVPISWRPRMKKFIRNITSPVGAFFVGFIVSLFLLPCTSGPYIVVISMLGHQETMSQAVRYLLLYNFIFVLPMIIISLATYFGADIDRLEDIRQKHLRNLHLIAGIILLIIGIGVLVYVG